MYSKYQGTPGGLYVVIYFSSERLPSVWVPELLTFVVEENACQAHIYQGAGVLRFFVEENACQVPGYRGVASVL